MRDALQSTVFASVKPRTPLAILAACVALLGAVLADVTHGEGPSSLDRSVVAFVVAHRQAWLDHTFAIVTWAGSAAVLAPVMTAAGLYAARVTQSRRSPVFLAVSLAGAIALSTLIKVAVSRPRPDASALVPAVGYAFPSGHATAATAGWVAVAIALGGLTATKVHKVTYCAIALLVAGIVGISRVYLGVHEPTDVIGGWALGGLWVAVILVTTNMLDRRRRQAPETGSDPVTS